MTEISLYEGLKRGLRNSKKYIDDKVGESENRLSKSIAETKSGLDELIQALKDKNIID